MKRLYNFGVETEKYKEELLPDDTVLDQISDSLVIGNEVYNIVEQQLNLNNNTTITKELIAMSNETLYYSYGLLGLNRNNLSRVPHISKEDKLNVSTEALGKVLNNIIETFKKIWTKIKEFMSKVWKKVVIWHMNIQSKFSGFAKDVRNIRIKKDIVLSKEDYEYLAKNFPYLCNNIKGSVGGMHMLNNPKPLDVLRKVAKDYNTYLETGDMSIFISEPEKELINSLKNTEVNLKGDNQLVTYMLHNTISYLYIDNNDKENIHYESTKYEELVNVDKYEEYSATLDYEQLLELANYVDKIYSNIKSTDNELTRITKDFEKVLKDVEDSKASRVKNLLFLINKLTTDVIKFKIDTSKALGKLCKRLSKLLYQDTYLVYEKYLNLVKENPVVIFKNDDEEASTDEYPLTIVKNGDMIYFSHNAPGDGNSGFTLDRRTDLVTTDSSDIELLTYTGGLVFLNEETIKSYNIPLEFIYWHEIGHIVTGYEEYRFPFDKVEQFKNSVKHYSESYSEGMADAYAAIKIGVNLKTVRDYRVSLFKQKCKGFDDKESFYKYLENQFGDQYLKHLEDCLQKVKSKAKLSLKELAILKLKNNK